MGIVTLSICARIQGGLKKFRNRLQVGSHDDGMADVRDGVVVDEKLPNGKLVNEPQCFVCSQKSSLAGSPSFCAKKYMGSRTSAKSKSDHRHGYIAGVQYEVLSS